MYREWGHSLSGYVVAFELSVGTKEYNNAF